MMQNFYNKTFPWKMYATILGDTLHRNFSFEIGPYHQQWIKFKTLDEAKAYMGNFFYQFVDENGKYACPFMFPDIWALKAFVVAKLPKTIHLGPIYVDGRNGRAWERKHQVYRAPFVCDIDIDKEHRAETVNCPCGSVKRCCDICWTQWLLPRLESAIAVLRSFNFSKLLTIYSGRRGAHVWVMDDVTWDLSSAERLRIINCIIDAGLLPSGIDAGVSTQKGHFCKAPLFPHAQTGFITCPISSEWRPSMAKHWKDVSPAEMQSFASQILKTIE